MSDYLNQQRVATPSDDSQPPSNTLYPQQQDADGFGEPSYADGSESFPVGQLAGQFADRVEDFLLRQVDRVELTIEQCQEILARETDLKELWKRIEHDRGRLEQDRQEDLMLIEQEAMRLVQAWLKLESEQRHESSVSGPVIASVARTPGPGSDSASGVAGQEQLASYPDADRGYQTREMAVRQFQQLRREIGKHARQAR
jgi:hypothetical protein